MDSLTIVRDASRSGTDIIGDLRLEWSANCNVGRVRQTNEDGALALPGAYLLADGMGGHDSGELASEAALQTLGTVESAGELLDTRDILDTLLHEAQDRIGEIDTESDRRAGTTATGAVLVNDEEGPAWLVLNIGDSRTYRYQNGSLQQLTTDHSQVQEFIEAGFITAEQARTDPRRNVITRALGAGMAEPVADYFRTVALPGDVLLVCSDGLTGELPDVEIEEILRDAENSEDAADRLVEAALAMGAHDNVTVIVVSVYASVPTEQFPTLSGDDKGAGEVQIDGQSEAEVVGESTEATATTEVAGQAAGDETPAEDAADVAEDTAGKPRPAPN